MDMIHVKTAIHKKMNKIEITDLTLPELQVYTSLMRRSYYIIMNRHREFLLLKALR